MTKQNNVVKFAIASALLAPWAALSYAQADSPKPAYMNPTGLYDASVHGYSQVTVAEAPARFIYLAGQGGSNEKGEISSDFKEQVEQALKNLEVGLAAANADITDVLKVSVYIVDHSMERLDIFEAAMKKMLDGRPGPASTLVPVPALALPSMQFEIDAIAVTAK